MEFRVGIGYDVHQLAEGYPLWLGGIQIEHVKGTVGHSDGDVLIHAICDAMLGAACQRDIGFHFPDSDPSLKGIDSKIILEKTNKIIHDAGYSVGNIDSTICLQNPKLKGFIPFMQETLERVLKLSSGSVSVKATTTEKLGFVGREEGVSAYAIVLLNKL
ncbi:MAG TPA: 2-C-methyl-D-erythritol 2,4-cyclodiphosphate synthase [Tenuifilaceae bacterium]|nr:2-C-methyl-D-erythritol 2,4-cyclodiphosphate synthase [Tenuifilaceae bacterium]HPE17330.1 2-C-methyl-D-erythritol 2,4-cyclodiphosphate synthase [Tenuifilaceae bacterium]HPJ44556.1 2-C-methyl-D-erythritol 2,4-cyclodiphosphate synthase [Tenuifilaceae bacterium]HPQ34863.1 2-C-methyl-D-erythritol 2,4-cyclodiphosphate synthase [Tenuifilaceae bacterium]HRX67638.1 2-C-methyl-D-erythritol 2,4-cyclodiphosphate synthase [Tenuifilaceae bacterium]